VWRCTFIRLTPPRSPGFEDPSIKPVDQVTARFFNRLAMDMDFGGIANRTKAEGERIAATIGNYSNVMMANHGVTTVPARWPKPLTPCTISSARRAPWCWPIRPASRSTIIKNGTIVTADLTYKADVMIEGGKITEIGPNLSATRRSTPPAAMSCPAASIRTPISKCRSWAPIPPMISKAARARRCPAAPPW
jgi:hypothetical protein